MRKLFLILFLLLPNYFEVIAQTQKATVYLLRSVGHDLDQHVPYFTYLDKTLLCKLGEATYSVHEVEPGEHRFHVQYKGKIKSSPDTELLVNLESGKRYYISVNIKTKAFGKGSFYCEQLSEEEGEKRSKAYLLRNKCF
jgi:hypothetical protein